MSDQNFSAIRARLRYETIEDFVEGYSRFISAGGMFIPMKPSKLKPIGTTIRFQFLLGDGSTALLGEGIVLQVRSPDDQTPNSPVGMLIKFTKLSQESKTLVDHIIETKSQSLKPRGTESQEQKHPTKPFEDDEDPMKTPTPPAFGDEDPSGEEEEGWGVQERSGYEHEVERTGQRQPEPEFEPELEEEVEADDPATAEAPAIEPETPTAEAPEPEELAESAEKPVAEHAGPKELGRTAGGVQILAFDTMGDEEMKDLGNFSFEGEESDIDDMFDGLFGAASDAESMFDGAATSGPTTKDSMSSVEFELPPEEELDALESDEEEPSAAEPAAETDSTEAVSEAEAFGLAVVKEDPDAEDFGFEIGSEEVPNADESDEFSVGEPKGVETDGPDDFGSSLPATHDESWSFEGADETNRKSDPDFLEGDDLDGEPDARHEIHSLIDHMEDEVDGNKELSLTIGIIEESKARTQPQEPEDSDSLEALLASARKEIEEKSSEEPRAEGDIIDQLIGDDLPPPPLDAPVFAPPSPKKKKGFLSRLFDKD